MKLEKCQDVLTFLNQVDVLVKANHVVWQGKLISKGEAPVSAKNIKIFLENNTDWLNSCKAGELGSNLKILYTRAKKEIATQEESKELITLLEKQIADQERPTPNLPPSLWLNIFSQVAKEPVQTKAVPKEKKADLSPSDQNAFLVYKNLALVSKGWRQMSAAAKAKWVDSHQLRIDDLGFKNPQEAVQFITACGENMHYLNVGFEFSDEEWQKIFNACPNLLTLKIRASNNTDKAFESLKDHRNIKQLVMTYNPKLTKFPELGSAKSEMLELGLLDWPVAKWPDLSKMTKVKSLNINYTRDPIDLAKVPLPPRLEDIFLFDLPGLSSVPPLTQALDLKKLSLVNCKNVSALPILSNPSKLEDLLLVEARQIKEIPTIHGTLKTLIIDGSDMTKLPDLSNQKGMIELKVADCPNLEAVPEFRNLASLQKLTFENCPKLAVLPNFKGLRELQEIVLKECNKLSEVPGLIDSTKLNTLVIDRCKKIKKLPEFQNPATLKYIFLHRTGIKRKQEFQKKMEVLNPKVKVVIKK